MGAFCQGVSTGGPWSLEEQKEHINLLELKAVKLALLTLTKRKQVNTIHLQIDNMTALSYLLKMGGTHSQKLLILTKEIWNFLIDRQIMITAEYLPSALNIRADWESRNVQDSSEWKLNQSVFKRITQKMGTPDMDLFASRLSHQIPAYMSWKPDPGAKHQMHCYKTGQTYFHMPSPHFST